MNELHVRTAWFNGGAAFCATLPARQWRAHRLVLLGAPGVGKGTQAELLCGRLGGCHLSTGDVFRAARGLVNGKQSLELREAVDYMRRGELVPDEIVLAMIQQRARCLRCPAGFVLDGFPRTVGQAVALHKMLLAESLTLSAVIHYELALDQLIVRLSGRRTCPKCKAIFHLSAHPPQTEGICDRCGQQLSQREDDNPESIRVRMQSHQESMVPLLGFYRKLGLLISVDATTPEETLQRTMEALIAKARS
jgi:adenylate kinase